MTISNIPAHREEQIDGPPGTQNLPEEVKPAKPAPAPAPAPSN